jgi:hypothetical protein
MKKKKYIILALVLSNFFLIKAQSAIVSSGSDTSSSAGMVSSTIGETIYTTTSSGNGSISQGTQQAYEVSTSLGINETEINLIFNAYPNPVTDYLTISINKDYKNVSFELLDSNGRLLESKEITSKDTNINMIKRLPSLYLLNIKKGAKTIKTYKIIKK